MAYAYVNILSATGFAAANLTFGALEVEGGSVSVPVYSVNSNTIYAYIQLSPDADPSQVSYSSWGSVAFPGQSNVYIQTNLGVGTPSPSYRLDISGVSRFQDQVRFKTDVWQISDSDARNRFYFSPGGRTYFGSGDGYEWRSSADTALAVITNAGNLGINETSPSQKLHVSGNVRVTGAYYDSANAAGTSGQILSSTGTGTAWISPGGGGGIITGSGTTNYVTKWTGTSDVGNSSIFDNGNVGIGTTGPSSKLHVSGNATDNVGLAYFENTSSTGIYYPAATFINNNGNHSFGIVAGFKIGTGADRPSILFYNNTGAHSWTVGQVTSGWGNNDDFGIGYRASNDPNSFGNWPSNYFTITTGGNVGIGSTAPLYKLQATSAAAFGTTVYGVLNIAADNPAYIKIRTSIPFSYGSQGYTVNVKGFQYGGSETLDLQICWHTYADLFYSQTITSKGSFAPVVRLARESGLVVIVITWGQYWPKLYVESVHNYVNDGYANGWSWVDENVTGDKTVTLSYKNNFGDGFVKTASGNVGVGNGSPTERLHVSNGLAWFSQTASNGSAFRWGALGTAVSPDTMLCMNQLWSGSGWDILNSGVGTTYINLGSQVTSPDIQFGTGPTNTAATTRMIIKNDGSVGIGNTAPSQLLHVSGNIRVTGAYYDSANSAGTSGQILSSTATGTAWIAAPSGGGITGSGTTNYVPKWTSGSAIGNSVIYDDGTNALIGTTAGLSGGGILQVNGDLNSTRFTNLGARGTAGALLNARNHFVQFNAGNVTIAGGWIAAAFGDASNNRVVIGQANVGNGAIIGGHSPNLDAWADLTTVAINHLFLNEGFSERMRITSGGNVGIGTTNPDAKLHVDGTIATNSSLSDVGAYRILKPNGGAGSYGSGQSGAIKITYPVGYTYSMHRVKVNVYEYTTNESFTIYFGGYNYAASSEWYNEFAYILSNSGTDRNFTVRFGYDGAKMVVYIGELSSYWQYPQIFIEEVEIGYSGHSATWRDGAWGIGFETSAFQNVTRTVSNSQATNWARNGSSAYYGFGNVGIGTTAPEKLLHISGGSGNVDNLILQSAYVTDGVGVAMQFNRSSGVLARIRGIEEGAWNGGLLFEVRSGSTYPGYNGATDVAMKIATNGNVGIGTTNPGAKLDVAGDILLSETGRLQGRAYPYDTTVGAGADASTATIEAGSTAGYRSRIALAGGNATDPNTIKFLTASAERMRITSGGNVGIGITNPNSKLHVNGRLTIGGDASGFVFGLLEYVDATTGFVISAPGRNMEMETGWNEKLTLKTGVNGLVLSTNNGGGTNTTRLSITPSTAYFNVTGNVGIGTTAPGGKLEVNFTAAQAATGLILKTSDNPNANGAIRWQNSSGTNQAGIGSNFNISDNGALEFLNGNTTNMIIRSSGNVGIGTTSPGYKLDVSGTIRATGDVIAYSDARVKENVETLDGALDKVMKMRGVSYNKIGEQEKKVGVIAQEILDVLPEVVSQDETGTYSVAYGNIVSVLIEAIKEQQKQIDELKSKLK
jgi:hypothetical protein